MSFPKTTGNENYEILDTGSVITFKDEVVYFQIASNLKVSLVFINDEIIKEQKISFNISNENELRLIFANFNSSLGTGNSVPLPIAKVNNRQIYLNIVAYSLSKESHKIVHYTFYSREEVVSNA
jgi:hypothetical protein